MSVAAPPLRYLSAADVEASMPPLSERLELAELTMRSLVSDAELPPKIAVHPRPDGSFGHAMPAYLRGSAADGSADGLGIKWVTVAPTNNALGLPAISAVVVLNDPVTGLPVAILDGGPITAHRTAAVSGVAIRAYGPDGTATRAALVGAGTQARSHLPVLGHVLPGVRLALYDRHPDRAAALAAIARETPGIGDVEIASSAREAVAGSGVVVTVASFTSPERRQALTLDWLAPGALVVPVDYATFCSAEVAAAAELFLVDDRPGFLAAREAGHFDGYPDPRATIGEALIAGTPRPAGLVVVTHLGVGLADVIFGRAIVARAAEAGRGVVLPR